MTHTGQDIRAFRETHNFTQKELSQILGVSRAHLAKLESRPAELLSSRLSTALEAEKRRTGELSQGFRKIKVLSWTQAGAGVDFEELPLDWQRSVSTDCPDENAFGLEIRGDSMEPKYLPGDVLILMPGNLPRVGSLVVLRLDQGDVLFKLYHPSGPTENHVTLTSFNSVYAAMFVHKEEIHWIYPVYEVIRKTWEGPVQCA